MLEWILSLFRTPGTMGATPRSPKWSKVRDEFLRHNPSCIACNAKADTAHHIIPYHLDPSLELDESNLCAMCDRCHLLFGHLCCWRSWNVEVVADASRMRHRIASRPG
jgi:hypothetical protein